MAEAGVTVDESSKATPRKTLRLFRVQKTILPDFLVHYRRTIMGFLTTTPVVLLSVAILALAPVTTTEAGEVWPTNGWSRAMPSEMGMDSSKLQVARNYALTGAGSGLIVRGGKIVMSWGNQAWKYELKSASKSIVITALALALKDGKMRLDDKADEHHVRFGIPPRYNEATGWLDDITILHLATMTAGFDKTGGYGKLLFSPGSKWAYSDGGPNWLGECITLAYRQDLYTIISERVFKPLGIKRSDFIMRSNKYRPDIVGGNKQRELGSGVRANVDAMARIGYLYLRDGRWSGQQIIPQNFVNAVRTTVSDVVGLPVTNDYKHRFAKASSHYGLLWWNNADGTLANVPKDAYWAWGKGDSLIVVIPSLDIVIARAGSSWSRSRNPNYYQVLEPFLGPIVESVRGAHTGTASNKTINGQ